MLNAIRANPEFKKNFEKAEILFREGNYDEAKVIYEALANLLEEKNADAAAYVRFQEAKSLYETAHKIKQADDEAYDDEEKEASEQRQASVNMIIADLLKDAENFAKPSLEKLSNSKEITEDNMVMMKYYLAKIIILQCSLHCNEDKMKEAAGIIETILPKSKDLSTKTRAEMHENLADILTKLDRKEEAFNNCFEGEILKDKVGENLKKLWQELPNRQRAEKKDPALSMPQTCELPPQAGWSLGAKICLGGIGVLAAGGLYYAGDTLIPMVMTCTATEAIVLILAGAIIGWKFAPLIEDSVDYAYQITHKILNDGYNILSNYWHDAEQTR